MTAPSFDSALGRALHRLAAALTLCCVATIAYALGTYGRETPWPYDVLSRRLMTEEVRPGGYLIMRRVIDYHEDCDIRYDRRLQSSLPSGFRFVAQPVTFESPPWERSGKPQQSSLQVPPIFPCGPAYLVESVSVGCTWYERLIRRRKKPDIITPFFVVGCGAD